MTRLAAALLLLLVLAGCGKQTDGNAVAGPTTPAVTSANPTTTTAKPAATTTKPPATTHQPGGNDVLGPDGWGPLKIGMDPTAASGTGVFADTPPAGDTCAEWPVPAAAPIESAIVSPTIGVAAIVARSETDVHSLHTPEGIGIGSTAEEVQAAYPSFTVDDVDTPNGPTIPVPGNAKAVYRLSFSDQAKVTYLVLESADQDCYA